MALPPDESLTSKDGTVLICVQCFADTCVQSHCTWTYLTPFGWTPLYSEHFFLGPVTVHYKEVSLYMLFLVVDVATIYNNI